MNSWLAHALGYGYAIVVGHVLVALVVGQLWRSVGLPLAQRAEVRPGWWLAPILGLVERGLFVAAILSKAHVFIGVWLAMKVAGQWKARVGGITLPDGTKIRGHSIFMIFLIGSGLSIGYAGVGASIISHQAAASGESGGTNGDPLGEISPVISATLLVLASLFVWLISYYYRHEYKKDRERFAASEKHPDKDAANSRPIRSERMATTDIGHVNPRNQRVVRCVGPSPTLPGQQTYELECLERDPDDGEICGERYGANGPDINGAGAGRGRRCPRCQGGVPGDPI